MYLIFIFSARCVNRTNHRTTATMFICPSGTGMHCDHTVHFSADLSLPLYSPMFWAP